MGKSEEKEGIFGKYTEHYDDKGNKIGESREIDGVFGKYIEHTDARGNKTGESREREGVFSDYTEHTDAGGNKIGESREIEGLFGTYTEHTDAEGHKIGESREVEGVFSRYTEHTGVGWLGAYHKTEDSSDDASYGGSGGGGGGGGDGGWIISLIGILLGLSLLIAASPLILLGYGIYLVARKDSPEARVGGIFIIIVTVVGICFGIAYLWASNESNKGQAAAGYIESAYVSARRLNVRSGPGSEYSVIAELLQGDSVICVGRAQSSDGGTWVRIRSGSFEGWVNQKLINTDISPQQAVPDSPVVSSGNLPSDTSQGSALLKPTCSKEAGARSVEGGANTSFTITNRTTLVLTIYWLDYQGERQEYFRLEPNETRGQDTYQNHPWLVTDPAGKCLRIFYAPAEIVID